MERLIKLLSLSQAIKDHKAVIGLIDRTITVAEIPSEVETIGAFAFDGCGALESLKMHDGIKEIKEYAFKGCNKMQLETIPPLVSNIEAYAFFGCHAITEITFKGTPKIIDAAAFHDCTNLLTINVPWAAGAVANAPWGATNATINYNYPTITKQPESVTASPGDIVEITLEATGTGLQYQWQYWRTDIATPAWYNSTLEGNTTNKITLEATTERNGHKYRCVITDTDGNRIISEVATLIVK